jgi:low temperature requirement protein LtrA
LYFDGEDERAERALRGADRARSPWLALYAFGYAFFVILGGIIVLAAGVKLAIVRSAQPVPAPAAWFLAGGVATYVVGLAWFRRLLGTGPLGVRLIVALLALSTGLVGLAVSAEAQLAVLLAILGGGVVAESQIGTPSNESGEGVREDRS